MLCLMASAITIFSNKEFMEIGKPGREGGFSHVYAKMGD